MTLIYKFKKYFAYCLSPGFRHASVYLRIHPAAAAAESTASASRVKTSGQKNTIQLWDKPL